MGKQNGIGKILLYKFTEVCYPDGECRMRLIPRDEPTPRLGLGIQRPLP